MTAITIADLTNAKTDVDHIAAIATSVELTATDRLGHVKSTLAAAIDSIKSFTDRGAWAALTVYAGKDLVSNAGSWYVCVVPHTSSAAFATDTASKWRVYQGVMSGELALAGASLLIGHQPAVGDPTTVGDELQLLATVARSASSVIPSRPALVEQHITGFFGRGMLTAETINVTTEQAMTAPAAAAATSLALTSVSNLVIGGCVSIKHDNGLYGTYFVSSISGSNIGILPPLRYACTVADSKIERTWYNRAHPGKFYIRELAQRIARGTELDAAMPNRKRVLYTNVSSDPNTLEDTLVATGSAAINYFAASNLGSSGTVSTPVRFALGRSAFVDNILATGDGAETQLFDCDDMTSSIVKVAMLSNTNDTTYPVIQVIDELGVERGRLSIAGSDEYGVTRIYTLPADLRGATQIKVRVSCEVYAGPGTYFSIHQIDVFDAPEAAGKIISMTGAKIVCIGDSWVAGDLGSTPEREPLTTQLAIELPNATITNAGVGGNTIVDIDARFDVDVAPYAPDYVIVNTGTNDSYNPSSGTFDPNAIDNFGNYYRSVINKIVALGARPIIIGVPALAQSDADVPAYAEWLLNDRARLYARYWFERQAKKPSVFINMVGSNANGSWTKFEDGTLICRHSLNVTTSAANTLGYTTWTFPVAFVAAPKVNASLSTYSSSQLISVGFVSATTTGGSAAMLSGVGGTTQAVDLIAVGRWF